MRTRVPPIQIVLLAMVVVLLILVLAVPVSSLGERVAGVRSGTGSPYGIVIDRSSDVERKR